MVMRGYDRHTQPFEASSRMVCPGHLLFLRFKRSWCLRRFSISRAIA